MDCGNFFADYCSRDEPAWGYHTDIDRSGDRDRQHDLADAQIAAVLGSSEQSQEDALVTLGQGHDPIREVRSLSDQYLAGDREHLGPTEQEA
jgi:hypothetical protein